MKRTNPNLNETKWKTRVVQETTIEKNQFASFPPHKHHVTIIETRLFKGKTPANNPKDMGSSEVI